MDSKFRLFWPHVGDHLAHGGDFARVQKFTRCFENVWLCARHCLGEINIKISNFCQNGSRSSRYIACGNMDQNIILIAKSQLEATSKCLFVVLEYCAAFRSSWTYQKWLLRKYYVHSSKSKKYVPIFLNHESFRILKGHLKKLINLQISTYHPTSSFLTKNLLSFKDWNPIGFWGFLFTDPTLMTMSHWKT